MLIIKQESIFLPGRPDEVIPSIMITVTDWLLHVFCEIFQLIRLLYHYTVKNRAPNTQGVTIWA